jgi:hypothetical protein
MNRESKIRLAQGGRECNGNVDAHLRACFMETVRAGIGTHSRATFGVTKMILISSESCPAQGCFSIDRLHQLQSETALRPLHRDRVQDSSVDRAQSKGSILMDIWPMFVMRDTMNGSASVDSRGSCPHLLRASF